MDFSKFSQKISKGFEQAVQFASEKFGTADEVTSYPPEFRLLEEKTDKIRIIYDNLMKINRQFVNAELYEPPIQEQMIDVFGKINEKLNLSGSGSDNTRNRSYGSSGNIKTVHHAAAKAALDGSIAIIPPDEMSQALHTYGSAMEKLGNARMDMDDRIRIKFLQPLSQLLEVSFGQVASAKKAAQRSRLDLDSVKSKCKTARPEKLDSLQKELAEAEEHFAVSVEDAIAQMKAVTENQMVIQCLADLVESQRSYYKSCYEVLNGVVIC